jgi:hypothetical protein
MEDATMGIVLVACRAGSRGGPGDDEIDLETHELGRQIRETLHVPVRRAVFDQDVATFDMAPLA